MFCAPLTMVLVVGSLEVLGWAQRAALDVIPPFMRDWTDPILLYCTGV